MVLPKRYILFGFVALVVAFLAVESRYLARPGHFNGQYPCHRSAALPVGYYSHPYPGPIPYRYYESPVHAPPGTFFDRGCIKTLPGGGIAILVDYNKRCSPRGLKPHPDQHQYYYFCKRNLEVFAKCPHLQTFNATKGDCETRSVPKPELVCTTEGRFPINDDCTIYYKCDCDLKSHIYSCPPEMIFSPAKRICIRGSQCPSKEISSGGSYVPDCIHAADFVYPKPPYYPYYPEIYPSQFPDDSSEETEYPTENSLPCSTDAPIEPTSTVSNEPTPEVVNSTTTSTTTSTTSTATTTLQPETSTAAPLSTEEDITTTSVPSTTSADEGGIRSEEIIIPKQTSTTLQTTAITPTSKSTTESSTSPTVPTTESEETTKSTTEEDSSEPTSISPVSMKTTTVSSTTFDDEDGSGETTLPSVVQSTPSSISTSTTPNDSSTVTENTETTLKFTKTTAQRFITTNSDETSSAQEEEKTTSSTTEEIIPTSTDDDVSSGSETSTTTEIATTTTEKQGTDPCAPGDSEPCGNDSSIPELEIEVFEPLDVKVIYCPRNCSETHDHNYDPKTKHHVVAMKWSPKSQNNTMSIETCGTNSRNAS